MYLLIDWSVLCHVSWHKMSSPNYEASSNIEEKEFAKNIALAMVYYLNRFKPEEVVLALDNGPYWRNDYYKTYYEKNTKAYVQTITENEVKKNIYFLEYDYKLIQCEHFDGLDKWTEKKLPKAGKAIFKEGLKTKDIVPIELAQCPIGVRERLPKYKGSRKKSTWNYSTSYSDWKILCDKLANTVCDTFRAKKLSIKGAEADDIAKVYRDTYTDKEVIFITTDSDWSQLKVGAQKISLFDPRNVTWCEKNEDLIRHELAIKIIAGDSSDDIANIAVANEKKEMQCLGATKAEKLVIRKGVPGIYKYLKENADKQMYERNLKLIYLNNMPKEIREKIENSLATEKVGKGGPDLEKYGVTKKDKMLTIGEAKIARDFDIEEDRYSA